MIGKHYLYRHIRLDKNEPFYVGIGTKSTRNHISITNEYYRAHSKTDRNLFWKNITSKTNYKVEILLESDDYDFIKQKEIEFITLYGRRDLKIGILCNLTDGGDGSFGLIVSKETKIKHSLIRKNYTLTEETLKKFKEIGDKTIKYHSDKKVGEKHITNQGYVIEIIEYLSSRNCTIRFENGLEIKNVTYGSITEKEIKNPYHKSISNIGYQGIGKYEASNKNKDYILWASTISKCYSLYIQNLKACYIEKSVCEEWHNFQNFAKWFEENYNYTTMTNWQLNVNLLSKGNKIYSPETCCFLPKKINNLLPKGSSKRKKYPIGVAIHSSGAYLAHMGVDGKNKHLGYFKTTEEAFQAYKIAKEAYIKEVAYQWKPLLQNSVYEALINYEIQITD